MARPPILTDIAIKALKTSAKDYVVFDGKVTGLGIRVWPSGMKTFIFHYRYFGRQYKMKLARYSANFTLAAARAKAATLTQLVQAGKNPKDEQAAQARDYHKHTIAHLVPLYIEHSAKHSQPRTWTETERILTNSIGPLGAIPVSQVRRSDLLKFKSQALERSSPGTVRNTLAALRCLFSWLIENEYIDASPFSGLKMPKTTSRQRILTIPELRSVWSASQRMGYPYGVIVQLLILTLQRRDEVAQMQWNELDLEQASWVVPDTRAKNKMVNAIHLSAPSTSLLLSVRKTTSSFVFPALGNPATAVSGFSKWKATLDSVSGVTDWRLHDLRRTGATCLQRLGVNEPIIEKILNHKQRSNLIATYQRYEWYEERRMALTKWGDFIATTLATGWEPRFHSSTIELPSTTADPLNCKGRTRQCD